MLSRENVVLQSAGDAPHAAARPVAGADDRHDGPIARSGLTLLLLALLVGLFVACLILNRAAVVQPRLRLAFASYERSSVPIVMAASALAGAAAALLARAAFISRVNQTDQPDDGRRSRNRVDAQAIPVPERRMTSSPLSA